MHVPYTAYILRNVIDAILNKAYVCGFICHIFGLTNVEGKMKNTETEINLHQWKFL
jgi:hypothetical protein